MGVPALANVSMSTAALRSRRRGRVPVQGRRFLGEVAERNRAEARAIAADSFERLDALEPVSREEVLRRLREGSVTLLDVRPGDEFALGHLPGAMNVPLDELKQRLAELQTIRRWSPTAGAPGASCRSRRSPPSGTGAARHAVSRTASPNGGRPGSMSGPGRPRPRAAPSGSRPRRRGRALPPRGPSRPDAVAPRTRANPARLQCGRLRRRLELTHFRGRL